MVVLKRFAVLHALAWCSSEILCCQECQLEYITALLRTTVATEGTFFAKDYSTKLLLPTITPEEQHEVVQE
eukprot:2623608-Amphidinium_carterae.1